MKISVINRRVAWAVLGCTVLAGFVGFGFCASEASAANILVSGGSSLRLYNPSGTLLFTYANDLIDARGVAVDPSGNVYVADYGGASGGSIRKYNSSGVFERNVMDNTWNLTGNGSNLSRGVSLTWNTAYNALSACLDVPGTQYGGTFAVLDPNATNTVVPPTAPVQFGNNYWGLTYVDRGGYPRARIYAMANTGAEWYAQTFYENMDFAGPEANWLTSPQGGQAWQIGVKESGQTPTLFAGNSNNQLMKIVMSGTLDINYDSGRSTLVSTGLNQPWGVAYDSGLNSVFVANNGDGTIARFDADSGAPVGTPFSVSGARYLASTTIAVPEPSTYALLLGGAAAALLVRRKKT